MSRGLSTRIIYNMQSPDKKAGLSGTGGFACPQTPPPLYASTRDSREEADDSDSDEERTSPLPNPTIPATQAKAPTSFPKHLPYRFPPPPLQKRLWRSDTFRIAMASSCLLIILAGTVTGADFLIIFFQKGSFHPKAVASMVRPTRTMQATTTTFISERMKETGTAMMTTMQTTVAIVSTVVGGLGKEMGPVTTTTTTTI